MLQAKMSKSKAHIDARCAVQTSYIPPLLSSFHYHSDYFYYYLHYFKTGNSNLGEFSFIAENRPLEATPSTTSPQASAGHFRHQPSKFPIQALTQRKQQLHPDRLAGCMKAILHAWQDEHDSLSYQQSGQ
jgi:hypothetical protein